MIGPTITKRQACSLCFYDTKYIPETLADYIKENGRRFEAPAGNAQKKTRTCYEVLGLNFEVAGFQDRQEMMDYNGMSVVFAETDLLDRISETPVNPGDAINFDSYGALKNWIKPDGKLTYTYSERLNVGIEKIIETLHKHPTTRQAFLSVWDRQVDIGRLEEDRVPCSIGFHFLIRNNELYMIYSMRSLEVTKCLCNDIYTSSRMLEYFVTRLNELRAEEDLSTYESLKVGSVIFQVGSAHVFAD